MKKQYYLKTFTVKTDADRATFKSNCLDFYLHCSSDGTVNEVICRDYNVVYQYVKGVELVLHKAFDFDNDIINFIVIEDDSAPSSRCQIAVHYRCIINEIEGLKLELKRNYNMKAKVLEWANKYRIKTKYVIN